MLRVLVAENDIAARNEIVRVLRSDDEIEVVRAVGDGADAVSLTARLRPNLVLMGVRLRTIGGLQATEEIMIECPTPILLLRADPSADEVELTVLALRAGALTVVPLPSGSNKSRREAEEELLSKVKSLSQVKLVRRWRSRAKLEPPPSIPKSPPNAITEIVAIAASTGGPAALERILLQLPASLPAPVLVVQHIASGFVEGVASWLDRVVAPAVKVAEHGERLRGGTVYLAPDGHHLGVSGRSRIALDPGPAVGGFCPSATHLFESVAHSFGRNAFAVILTGMGRDGVDGLHQVRKMGGHVIAQDEASSIVFGMPRQAAEEGVASQILPVSEIGAAIIAATRSK